MMQSEPEFHYCGTYDENWPLPALLTFEQYRRVIFRPDAHFVDGRVVQRTLGELDHSQAIGVLLTLLDEPCRMLKASCCISLRLQVSPTRVRVCDFVVLEPGAVYEPIPTIAPLLCVEVLASSQMPADELDTLDDYWRMGVKNIWLLDPIRQVAYTFDSSGLRSVKSDRLAIPNSPIELDLTELFAAME